MNWHVPPPLKEGRFAIVTNVEAGCDCRDQRVACSFMRTNALNADGEIVWSWPPGAEVKLA